MDSRIPVIGRSAAEIDLTRATSVAELTSLLDSGTAVVICAAIKKQLGDNLEVAAENLAITLNVCRALAARPARRIVFFSSAAVYGEDVQHDIISEMTGVVPTSYYGIAKFTAERLLLRTVGQRPDSSLLILRPALVYGPDEPADYYGPSGFLRMALGRMPITLWGDGTELREFLFIDDIVALARRLTFSGPTGVINLVSGTSYTYLQALDAIAAIIGERPGVTARPRTKAKVDHRFDASALRKTCPGFEFTSMQAGLQRIAATAPGGARA
jgi:UDP-glucose 4-epimerase